MHEEGRLWVTICHAGTHSFRPGRTAGSCLPLLRWLKVSPNHKQHTRWYEQHVRPLIVAGIEMQAEQEIE